MKTIVLGTFLCVMTGLLAACATDLAYKGPVKEYAPVRQDKAIVVQMKPRSICSAQGEGGRVVVWSCK